MRKDLNADLLYTELCVCCSDDVLFPHMYLRRLCRDRRCNREDCDSLRGRVKIVDTEEKKKGLVVVSEAKFQMQNRA